MVVANVTLTICGATLTYTQIRVYSYVSRWKRIQMATTKFDWVKTHAQPFWRERHPHAQTHSVGGLKNTYQI